MESLFQQLLKQENNLKIIILLIVITTILNLLLIILIPQLARSINQYFISNQIKSIYQKIIAPFQGWIGLTICVIATDLIFQYFLEPKWINIIEIPTALTVAGLVSWLGASIFSRYFDAYLLEAAIQI